MLFFGNTEYLIDILLSNQKWKFLTDKKVKDIQFDILHFDLSLNLKISL